MEMVSFVSDDNNNNIVVVALYYNVRSCRTVCSKTNDTDLCQLALM